MAKHSVWSDEQSLRKLVAAAKCNSDVLKAMGLVPTSNVVTLRKYLRLYNIDTSHFDATQARLDRKHKFTGDNLEDVLVENSTRVDRFSLKKRLVKEGYLQYKCYAPGCIIVDTWNGKPVTLQLEHKNGDRTDNRIENLELLCPNCHSQTGTFAGRNKCK